jgi:hypothetical protein
LSSELSLSHWVHLRVHAVEHLWGTASQHQLRSWHHQVQIMGHKIKWLVHLFLRLLFFFLFSVFSLLADMLDSGLEFRHELNHVGHGKFIHTEPPRVLEDEVGSDVLVAGVKGGGEELFLFSFDEELEEVFNDFGVVGLSGSFDTVFVHFVLL